MEYQYFEISIGSHPEESDDDFWICIRGVRTPSIREAEQFLAADTAKYGGHVLGVYPLSRKEAEAFYDFSHEEMWPVFGRDDSTIL